MTEEDVLVELEELCETFKEKNEVANKARAAFEDARKVMMEAVAKEKEASDAINKVVKRLKGVR